MTIMEVNNELNNNVVKDGEPENKPQTRQTWLKSSRPVCWSLFLLKLQV